MTSHALELNIVYKENELRTMTKLVNLPGFPRHLDTPLLRANCSDTPFARLGSVWTRPCAAGFRLATVRLTRTCPLRPFPEQDVTSGEDVMSRGWCGTGPQGHILFSLSENIKTTGSLGIYDKAAPGQLNVIGLK